MPKLEIFCWSQEGPFRRRANWQLYLGKDASKSFTLSMKRSGQYQPEAGQMSWRNIKSPRGLMYAVCSALEYGGGDVGRTTIEAIAARLEDSDLKLATYFRRQIELAQEPSIMVSSREQATMASSWTEHLFLQQVDDASQLIIMGSTILADDADYCDEDGELLDLPEEIDGQKVIGWEDGYIMGLPMVPVSDREDNAFRFTHAADPKLRNWIETVWNADNCDLILCHIRLMLRLSARGQLPAA